MNNLKRVVSIPRVSWQTEKTSVNGKVVCSKFQ